MIRHGLRAHEQGDLQEALRCYRLALKCSPVSAMLLTHLGNLQQDLEDAAAAVACYLQAVEIDSSNSEAQADVGFDTLAQTLCYSRMAPIQAVTWGHRDPQAAQRSIT